MKLFRTNKSKLEVITETPFKLEKDIQSLVESNLFEFFSLEFVASELSVDNFRIDTLAFDYELNSFVIIEYKKGSSYSVIDQGFTYLSLLLNNKSDFVLEYNETKNKSIKRDSIDWSQSKIVFISPNFSAFQKTSVNFKDVPFELWEIKRFSNSSIILNELKNNSKESIGLVGKSNDSLIKNVSKEIRKFTEEDHINGMKFKNYSIPKPNDTIRSLYFKYKERLLDTFPDAEIKVNKCEIGFIDGKKCFVYFSLGKSFIKIWLNLKMGELKDELNLTRDVSDIGHWGVGDYEIKLENENKFEYVLSLIEQAYSDNS